jgi:hypothetical protein
VIKFVSDLRQVGGFLWVITNKNDRHNLTEILLKVAFNTKRPKIKAKRDYSYKSTFSRQKGWTYKREATVHDLMLNKNQINQNFSPPSLTWSGLTRG